MKYIIIGILLAGGLIFYLTSCGNKSQTSDSQTAASEDKPEPKVYHTKENTYGDMRSMAFSVTPEDLGLSLPAGKTVVYGVIMDWEIGGAVATVVAYQTGDASMYLSSGGGVIGGGQHENVAGAAKKFVNEAQGFLNKAASTESMPLPSANEVKFYLMTNKGVLAGQEQMKNFESSSSPWQSLFEEGNNVLTELRKVSE